MASWKMTKQILKESGKFEAFESLIYNKQCELQRDLTEEEEQKIAEIVLCTPKDKLSEL